MTGFVRTVVSSCPRCFIRLALIVPLAVGTWAVAATGAVAQEGPPEVEFHPPEGAGSTDLPFSEVVRVGSTLYLSGQLGVDPETGQLVSGGVQAETRRIMQNIKTSLRRHGSSMNRVVKCTVFLADMSEWGAMNEAYVEFFPENRPARSAVGVNGLALDARVEIECIAVAEGSVGSGGTG